jgi:hypothetical protein
MSAHHDTHSNHSDHHGQTNPMETRIKNIKRFLFLAPIAYPFYRVQTLMQSHLTLPAGETLPNFRKSFQIALNQGGLYKGFTFYLVYLSSVLGSTSIHPALGVAAMSLFYPLELMQIYSASNGLDVNKLSERMKKGGSIQPYFYRGFLMNFLTANPIFFFLNNIKRNYVLRTDEGIKTSYREVFKSFDSDPRKIFRGGVPALLTIIIVAGYKP